MFKKISLFMVLIMTVFAFSGCNGEKSKIEKEELSPEEEKYSEAMEYIEDGKYTAALDIITELGDFKDCIELREKFVFKCSRSVDDYGEVVYTYDDNGNKLTYELISDELPWEKTIYTYNDKNQCIEEVEEGYLERVAKNTYDSEGNLILTEYDNNGRIEYEYDSNNCIKEHIFYGEPYSGEKIVIYTYDADNNCITMVEQDQTQILLTTNYTYNENGNLINEEKMFSHGSYEKTEYTYDEDGCCIERNVVTPNWNSFYSNEFDKYGNLIRSDCVNPQSYTVDTTLYEYVLFYDGKPAHDYVQDTSAKDDLAEEELIKAAKTFLKVPGGDNIISEVGEKYYDIGKGLYYVPVTFYENEKVVAGANVHAKTGELVSNIMSYGAV